MVFLIKYELLQLREQFLIFTEFPFHSQSETEMWRESSDIIGRLAFFLIINKDHEIKSRRSLVNY